MVEPVSTNALQNVAAPGGVGPGQAAPPTPSSGKAFADFILERLGEVNQLQKEADAGVQKLLTGETDNIAEVFAASNKAGIAFDLLMEVRNKLLEAYREIQQMRV